MNILFVGQQSLQSPSGLGRHWPMAKELVKLGHRVRIITLHHDWQNLEQPSFIKDGVEVCYVGQMQVLKRQGVKSYFPLPKLLLVTVLAVWQLWHALRGAIQEGFDYVHILKPQPINSLPWLLLPSTMQKRCYLFVDCDDFEVGSAVNPKRWMLRILRWFELAMPRRAKAVTVNTDFMWNQLVTNGLPETKLIKLPNGIDRDRFAYVNTFLEQELRSRYRANEHPLIIYVGTLSVFTHDVDLLLKAFALLLREVPTAKLLLVGDGEDRSVLAQLTRTLEIDNSVIFVGSVPSDQIPTYFRIAQLSVEPTRTSLAAKGRSPLKIVESLASGTPVVCGAVGERIHILQVSEQCCVGILALPNNEQALAEGMISLLANPSTSAVLGELGRRRSEEFVWDLLVTKLVDMYQNASANQLGHKGDYQTSEYCTVQS